MTATAIIEARWNGETIDAIRTRLGVPRGAVTKALDQAGFPFRSSLQVRALQATTRDRLRSGGTPLCDPNDIDAFRAYLVDRGITHGAATVYASNARVCLNAGISDPENVDAVFSQHQRSTRRIYRSALRWFRAYQNAQKGSG